MKKRPFILLNATILLSGILLTGCLSTEQKKEAADAQVVYAEENLNKVQKNADVVAEKAATAEEFKIFKLESEIKIKKNEVSIAELNLKMNQTGSDFDKVYASRIDSLELKNKNLESRIDNYEKTHSDWTRFKQDFNRDLDELGNKLKKIAEENSKK